MTSSTKKVGPSQTLYIPTLSREFSFKKQPKKLKKRNKNIKNSVYLNKKDQKIENGLKSTLLANYKNEIDRLF